MTRGRKPLPTVVKQLNGNPGKRPLNKKEPEANGDLKKPPAFLSPDQVVIWKNTLKVAPKGLLKLIDEATLAKYVVAYDMFQKASQSLANGDYVHVSEKGAAVRPEVQVVQKAAGIMDRACSEMGFTPSSRSRLNQEDPRDPDNPFENL